MSRPLLEMADIVRCAGQAFVERSRNWITWQHQKVLLAITRCRTAALGGHRDRCTGCGQTTAISYNSCRNRHCPRCQGNARQRWLEARQRELLPTPYVHVIFTLPHYTQRQTHARMGARAQSTDASQTSGRALAVAPASCWMRIQSGKRTMTLHYSS